MPFFRSSSSAGHHTNTPTHPLNLVYKRSRERRGHVSKTRSTIYRRRSTIRLSLLYALRALSFATPWSRVTRGIYTPKISSLCSPESHGTWCVLFVATAAAVFVWWWTWWTQTSKESPKRLSAFSTSDCLAFKRRDAKTAADVFEQIVRKKTIQTRVNRICRIFFVCVPRNRIQWEYFYVVVFFMVFSL